MPIPDFQTLMLPLLKAIADGQEHDNGDVVSLLAKQFDVTEEEQQRMLPSGQQRVFANRVAWAKAHLKRAELLDSPHRGATRITEQGKGALAKAPERINLAFLRQFPSYDWHKPAQPNATEPEVKSDTDGTPKEQLESSYATLREQLAAEVLEKLKTCSPAFFERVVVQLLVAMGYGGSLADAGQAVGRSGDGGIDGVIKEDKLGLDVVCVQAKRWPENTVGRPVVQAFVGSMEGFRAKKGVVITTSSFSRDAHDYVSRTERKIALVDGKQLAELMIDHDIGVTTEVRYVVKRLDLDYFIEDPD